MYPLLTPPVVPWQGTRQIDDFGAGGFGAPRDGGRRTHKGLDCLGKPGDEIVALFDARVWPPSGQAYTDGRCNLRSIHLLGTGPWLGMRAVLLYVAPDLHDDAKVAAGAHLGRLQDVAAYHETTGKHMDNHTHLEVYELVNGVWKVRDPAPLLQIR